jgi:hypothetical protein
MLAQQTMISRMCIGLEVDKALSVKVLRHRSGVSCGEWKVRGRVLVAMIT